MLGENDGGFVEVGDGPSYFDNFKVAAGGELKGFGGGVD